MTPIWISTLGAVLAATAAGPPAEKDAVFAQEVRATFAVEHGLPDRCVNAICLLPNGKPIAATPKGLARFDGVRWQTTSPPPFEVRHLAPSEVGLWVAGEHRLAQRRDGQWQTIPLPRGTTIRTVAAAPEGALILGTNSGLSVVVGKSINPITSFESEPLSLAVSSRGELAVGTASGLYVGTRKGSFLSIIPEDSRYRWAPRDVRAVVYDSKDRLWFAAQQGVGVRDKGWRLFAGKEGLPYNRFTCAASHEQGPIWFGTSSGAIRYDGKRWAYRASRRWLPDDHVNDIAIEPDGTAWLATPAGISRIEPRPMTLAQKAEYFERQVEARHNRMGFVVPCRLQRQGDVSSWAPAVTDNDGQYTSLYGAAEAFRYAATKDPDAKQRAKRSFAACKWLVEITPMPGFPARAIVPVDWPEPVNEQYGEAYNRQNKAADPLWKEILPRWPKSADGKYLWKCDTSSDEMAGHYFFYGVYYDLVAETKEEKEDVRSLVREVTDSLIANGFRLIDHDGLPTRWANWSPKYLNSLDGWQERGLQSMMVLSFLKVAQHITGDDKYGEAARMLRDKYSYHINAMLGRMYFPPDYVVPWDNLLALVSYYGLLKYETDPELLKTYRMSLSFAWQFVSRHKHPLYNVIYGSAFPDRDCRLADALQTLRGIPLELMGWTMKNTHRLDVVIDPTPGQRPTVGWSVLGGAIPIEERSHVRLDRSSLALDTSEGDGHSEHEGTIYLLPYYMALYHGFIR